MRPIDADAMLAELKPVEFEDGYKSMPIADVSKIMRDWVGRQPTITPQNELTCVGCCYIDEQCAPCASCIRAQKYADYYCCSPDK